MLVRNVSLLSAALCGLSVAPAGAASDLLQYSDFGRADILLTAASIRQSGDAQIARIDQITDASNTDRAIYPTGDGNTPRDGGAEA